jgi:Ca-activated chloride channel family protein
MDPHPSEDQMFAPHSRRSLAASLLGAIALLTTAAAPLPAPGRVAGWVKDQAGAPITGAQVVVDGTTLAALTDTNGHYLISGISPGQVVLKATFVGYRPLIIRNFTITGGQTSRVDFPLEAATVDNSPIVLDAARARTTGELTESLPADRIARVLALQPGVVASSGDGLSIRGGRTDESVTYTDGVPTGSVKATNGFTGAGAPTSPPPGVCCYRQERDLRAQQQFNTEEYAHLRENGFRPVSSAPLSTFSIDVDKASYANIRRFLTQGSLPPVDAVRIEEMINYFSYEMPEPRGEHPFSITTEVTAAPWATSHRLVRIGIQGKRLRGDRIPPSNLVFLIDVSGSMASEDKLGLVKKSLRLLVQQLREEDKVSIVVYAGAAGLVLPCTPGTEKTRILNAIDHLEAGGSTAGGAGIQLAYKVARENLVREGNNRVILATDGDFNVGPSSEGELVRIIETERKSNVFLTVLGFGTGNYSDQRMESIADKGNGNYFYVDNILEGRKVFVEELQGTLFTIAKDVKIQVEFNPAEVASYRLVGYENRALRDEDFNNDSVDAGELGAGHSVTALYEIVPVGAQDAGRTPGVDPLRYQPRPEPRPNSARGELMTVKLRYQRPEGSASRLLEQPVRDVGRGDQSLSHDFAFAIAVSEFGMLLRNSEYKGTSNVSHVLQMARSHLGEDRDGYREEFVQLVRRWQAISGNRGEEVGVRE